MRTIAAIALLLAAFPGCTPVARPEPSASEQSAPRSPEAYRLGVGDRLKILVYDEPKLSGEFVVNSVGMIEFPLIGDVAADDRTTAAVRGELVTKLSAGFLRSPRITVDVAQFRPFYILGEVNKPGEYPFSIGLTVLKAVATAQGFTYRANRGHVFVTPAAGPTERRLPLTSTTPVHAGDTIRIGERYF